MARLPRCDTEPAKPAAEWPTPKRTVRSATFIMPADLPAQGEPVGTPPHEPVNLDEALAVSLERNPTLVTMRQAVPVSSAALDVARTYPFNPFVQFQVLPFSQTNTGAPTALNHYVLLWQTLELAHQSRYRSAAGVADLTRVQWNVMQAELTNIALTERMFFAALYQRGVRDLNVSLARLNDELVGVLDRRFVAGQAMASDVALARLQAHAARQQANLAITGYNTALFDLRTQLGMVGQEPFEPRGQLEQLQWQPAVPSTTMQPKPDPCDVIELVSGRPDVMAARADVSFGRANADLARANRVPNLLIGPYYQRDDFGTLFLGFRSQVDIPVINDGMALWRQRLAELRQREVTLSQLQNRAQLEAEAAIERYERARRLIAQSQDELAGALAEDVRRVESQYQAGQTDLVRVYAARTGLLQAQRAYLDTLSELAQTAARVTETTGLPPGALLRDTGLRQPEPTRLPPSPTR